ncbi:ferritin-like domain-containing protein [Flavisolibacter sp. BT320]|nr:ferritin-like domain-containing protein [Flavisolibacter longurius]
MEILKQKSNAATIPQALSQSQINRRSFLRWGGTIGATVVVAGSMSGLTGCRKDDDGVDGINLGSGDIGVLNYAYALEQLEAAFYTQVVQSQYANITAAETAYLTDIRDHEIAHREFFKKALGNNAIPALEVNFSAIDFGNRASVLGTAKAFEDLGVSAYNGAGKLLTDVNYLLAAGKIVSVEARHAALIRELLSPNSFGNAEVVDSNGLDLAKSPRDVLSVAAGFLKSKVNATNLPTS